MDCQHFADARVDYYRADDRIRALHVSSHLNASTCFSNPSPRRLCVDRTAPIEVPKLFLILILLLVLILILIVTSEPYAYTRVFEAIVK